LAAYCGHKITYVKPHGALANIAETDFDVAQALARAVRAVDPSLAFLGIALSAQVRAGERAGLRTISEIFADRGYAETGRLLPRGTRGGFIDDPDEAASRVIRMIGEGSILTEAGARLPTPIGSICVHSDAPGAVRTAAAVRGKLQAAGITLAAFAAP
jgi:UPF0271 protein